MQISAIYENMGGDGANMYDYIKKQTKDLASKDAIKQYIPSLHDVADKGIRPDKPAFRPTGENGTDGKPVMEMYLAPVSRAPFAIQKYIIGQKASFARGNGVILKPTKENSKLYDRVWNNWQKNKISFDLKNIFERKMAETQVAVIFYGERGATSLDEFVFKHKIVSPLKGDKLTPYFDDDNDDFIAFGREYKRGKITVLDFYYMRADGFCEILRYKGKVLIDTIPTPYTKLPIIYWEQPEGECEDTKDLIREMEFGFNEFITGLGYTADPILFGKGKVMDLPAKGSAGKFIESTDPDADLKYVTPDNATEARELQFKLLQRYIFSLNRAVLLDLDTMKDLGGNISGAALERYLIDAYMEATDKQQGEEGKGVQRMVNWLTSQWALLQTEADKTFRIDVEFTKYSMQDELERVELAVKANGNKAVVDIESGVAIAGLVDDVVGTTAKIVKEGQEAKPVQTTPQV